ncbi:MAG: ABC transporter permease, partial [Bacteriovorax sp.]|nr:ABC transporter permease [Rhizobacter sp.]
MSAVLSARNGDGGGAVGVQRSAGVWSAAAARFRTDKVGMTSAVIVALFLLLVLAAALGMIAKDWQAERGVPDAPPTFVG